jgi:hypothetical protein
MSISASMDLFVLDKEDRWSIRSKWEAPILNFSGAISTTPGPGPTATYNGQNGTTGMWHQYGTVPGSSVTKRLNVRIDDKNYVYGTTTGSLASAVGFEKKAIAFGKIKPKTLVEEAVCCVPFVVDPDNGEEKFLDLPIEQFEENYLSVRENKDTQNSIMDMIRKMDKYVLPPIYDFVYTRDASDKVLNTKEDFEPTYAPFAMYFFEFKSELSKEDLAKIWQGVMPSIATAAEKEMVTIEHPIKNGEVMSPSVFSYNGYDGVIPENIRWKIFKVKKRAKYDYYEVLSEKTNTPVYKNSGAGRFSFNYPYDYFSLVELGKMNVDLQVINENSKEIKEVPGSYIKI